MSYALFTDADDRDAGGWAGAIFGGAAAGGLAAATFGASLAVGGTIASGVGLSGAAGSAVSVGIGGAISGTLGGAAGSVVQQSIATGSVDAGQVGADAGYGAAGGAIGAGVGKLIAKAAPYVGGALDDVANGFDDIFRGSPQFAFANGVMVSAPALSRATARALADATTRATVRSYSSFGSSFAFSVGRSRGGGRVAQRATGPAHNASSGVRLNKNLASQQQVGEVGSRIAGQGTSVPFRNANRVAQQYGGNASDWAKMRSSSHLAPDGTQFRTHWVENTRTGQRVEFKTKIAETAQ